MPTHLPKTIRAKLVSQIGQPGHKGKDIWFNAVYEGSPELQKLSENSMFGDATPNGQCQLGGDLPADFPLINNEEYFFDFTNTKHYEYRGSDVLALTIRKTYQSEPPRDEKGAVCQLRFIGSGSIAAHLYMGVANPEAIKFFDRSETFVVFIYRVPVVRQSEAVIAVHQKNLDDFMSNTFPTDERGLGYHNHHVNNLKKKLAKAQGIDLDKPASDA